jgi:lipid II:glycine glycyltransferase (peptidoglycan interpeptide bridge formation enzyme)
MNHPLQSSAWGAFRKSMGIDVVVTHGWQLTFHNIPYLPFTIGYFPKGPKPTKEMIDILTRLGKEKHAIFIQLEPNVIKNSAYTTDNLQLIPSHHPLFTKYTFILDLTKSEEQLLKDMHHKTRYNIKVAQRHKVVIREDSSLESFEQYLDLTEETTKRQKFYAHTPLYHKRMWDTMHSANIAKLWKAEYNGKPLAIWIIFCFEDTIYYPYGASSREHKEVMATHLLLWEIAKWGRKNGYKKFDLWGALGPDPDKTDPWYGFHRFKEGFHPELVEFMGSYDLVINPLLYRMYCMADNIRWKLLKIKR